jgi:hypothetical protein
MQFVTDKVFQARYGAIPRSLWWKNQKARIWVEAGFLKTVNGCQVMRNRLLLHKE